MVQGDVVALLELQAVSTIGSIEDTILQYAVDIEVGLHLVFRDVEQFLLHLGRIVEAVIGLQLELLSLGLLGEVLDSLRLGIGSRTIGLDEVLQEGIYIVGSLGHGALQRVGRIVGIAHQRSLLGPQLGNLDDEGEGVMLLVGAVGTMDRSLEDTLSQVAVVEIGEQCLLSGIDDHDGVGCLLAEVLGILGALGDIGIGEASELLLGVDPDDGVVGGSRQLIAPLLLEVGDTEVDLLHALHLVVGQQGTLADKALIGLLQELLLLAGEGIVLDIVHLLDTLEERLIERDFVLQVSEQGHHLLLYLTQFGSLVSFCQGEEHTAHPVEQTVALVQGQDGVLEVGRIRVVHNLGDAVASGLDGCLEGRQIVGDLNLAEIGGSEGQRTLRQQRIFSLSLGTGCKLHRQGRCCTDSHKCPDIHYLIQFLITRQAGRGDPPASPSQVPVRRP